MTTRPPTKDGPTAPAAGRSTPVSPSGQPNPWVPMAWNMSYLALGALFGAGLGWGYLVFAGSMALVFVALAFGWRSGRP